ncbi:MAG TPA: ubiquitin-like small modifier protein 1 [Candidatus Thermoplasmatota archaeon]|nr:ubiquitin-like small modifier protein 1 [Candidatus Thermoplasmatota archaeon]
MTVTVRIPTALRQYAGSESRTAVDAKTVGDALAALVARHPALKPHLYEESGRLRSFVNVYLGERDVRELGGQDAPVREGDTLILVPSVAGGC